ncbi:hypothetical protein [Cytobacillus depressus]|uniref:hypothetical protein n=1 Tax=Cytobacillus depressus TaxID=1602942 RepID=UPI00124E8B8E|nr:hypothetical protein [Cytobacillus depressus]
MINNTSKRILADRVRSELTRLSIPFTEESSDFSNEHQFIIEDATIKIYSPRGGKKEIKTFHLSFIKWWRLSQFEEVNISIVEKFREERDEVIFWKQILTSLGGGCLLIILIFFVIWKF